jgi:hypothetical protein
VTGAGDPNIQGFTTSISVNKGETVQFKIGTDSTHYRLDIYRMGYYQGNGARKVATLDELLTTPQVQPAPLTDPASGLIDYGNWGVSASWSVPTTAVSGIYFAKLVREDGIAGSSHVFFVVRDDGGTSDLLYQTSDTTWEAYNTYGGNSLYTGNGSVGRAYKVSYNRPFNDRGTTGGDGTYTWVFHSEYPMVRWLEANGYDVSYFTHVDTAARGTLIRNHKVFMSVGHDEYWSAEERNAVTAARDAGVNVAFFSGNEMVWKTRWETSIDGTGTPYRTLVCYKETKANKVLDPLDPSTWTGTWRDPRFSPPADGGQPENALSGTIYRIDRTPVDKGIPLQVPGSLAGLRFWRNTSVAALSTSQLATLGDNVVGFEVDVDWDNGFRPAGLIDLSATTFTSSKILEDYGQGALGTETVTHSATLYRAASGALVFSAGTVNWSWGLDGHHDDGGTGPDVNIQQATLNLLADMGAQPGSIQSGLVAATASTDHTAPTSTILLPSTGVAPASDTAATIPVTSGVPITIYGTATDAGGGVVGGVEVSVDGGVTWHPASGRNNWSYVWTPNTNGTVTIKSRAVDDSGNLETPSAGVTVSVAGPLMGFNSQVLPDIANDPDPSAIELGVKFRTDVAGYVTGIRFYKGTSNTGTHVGNLWTSTGTLLATATFTSESASGWQTVTFSTPVAISANTTYVASYHTNVGHYSDTGGAFRTTINNGPLHILANGVDGPNGVYTYSAGSTFPNKTNGITTNYWVDVLFNTTNTDVTSPQVQSVTPQPGSPKADFNAPLTATFTESVQASTISFVLKDSSGNPVAASLTYNDTTHTATLTPTGSLAAGATYFATVSGARDLSGNLQAASVSWSFTTYPSLGKTGPFTNFAPTSTPAVLASSDPNSVELGLKFRTDVSGYVTGVRFYKGPTNTGTHTGSLWSSTGALLAQATFVNETISGWQQVNFATPVFISANTTYVVSYHTNVGNYSYSSNYFGNTVDNAPLHALGNGIDGPNGVYLYGANPAFPTTSGNGTNYWVDAVFSTAASLPPTIATQSPNPGAVGVAITTPVKVTFSEAIQSDTLVFTLKDANNNPVSATVSYDSTTLTATLTPTLALANSVTYTATVSGVKDLTGTPMTAPVSWSFTTIGTGPFSFWSPSTTPAVLADTDSSAIELGVKFRTDVPGTITGIKFYKGSTNTGTHVGNLWDSTGTLLASATFTSETASGWQTVTFSTPVAISANTTYVASYHTNVGHYSDNGGYFTTTGVDNGPLHALAAGVSGPNGVYAYGTTSKFPTSSYNSTNYWVDVIFAPAVGGPTVTTTTPAAGANGAATNLPLKATFSTAVQPGTISFTVKDAANNPVTGSVTYDATTNTATFTPAALLAVSTTYTATVSGAQDSSGNAMVPVSWSFTTEAAPTVTSQTPTAGASNVLVGTSVNAVFSKAVQSGTISFTLKDAANNPVAGSVTYNASTNTATFTPTTKLATSVTYTATVSGAKDSDGNAMAAPVSWSFTTETVPAVSSTSPAAGSTNVVTTTTVQAAFNKAVVASTISFNLKDAANNPVTGTVSYNAATNTAIFTPATLLAPSTSFTATLSGAADASGNVMTPVSWSFTTEAAPVVTSTTPAAAATNVAATATIQAVFSKPVQSGTISFTLKDAANNPVAGSLSYNVSTNTATFTPGGLLAASTTFTATVSGAKDSSGNLMAPVSWSFTTDSAPAISSTNPAAAATNVVTTTTVQAVFTKAVVASTISFTLKDASNNPVTGTVAYNATTNTATFTPTGLLAPSTTFTATISGATDSSGNQMVPVSWSFTTEAAPTVVSQTPVSGATNVVTTSTMQAVFNKAVQANTISFTVKDAANNPVAGTVSYNAATNTATFTPSALLATATTYVATVSGANDASGNLMAPLSWSFTTEAGPALTSQTPASGATNVVTTSIVQGVFNKAIQSSTLSFVLKDASGATVASTVAYNASTNTATLTPNALLATATTFTATVSGAKDASGNLMAPVSWSFTTEAAPALTSTTPAAGATNVATNGTVQAVFNKAVQSSTISLTLKDAANNPVSGTVGYNAATNTVTFTPSGLLATATTFTATVSGIKDASGNLMSPVSWSFTTEAAPALTSQNPAAGATNVPTIATIQAVFTKAVVASTISFTLKDAANNPVAGTVSYNAATNTATFTPSALLATLTTYVATVSSAQDVDGNVMAPVSWSFTTTSPAPTVTSTNPAAAATNVVTTAPIQATFNEAVVASTISFTVKDAANNPVSGTVAYNATTNTATFTPNALLATSTTYTATVSGVQDSSGNAMAAPVSWSFATEAAPVVTSTTPAASATNVPTTSTLQAIFSKAVQSGTLSFTLKDAANNPIAGSVAYNAATNTATFTPTGLLAPSTTFTATVSGAKDTSGNVMVPVSWSFTTEAAPTVVSQTPVSGATNVATTSTVQAAFSKAVVASTISFTLKDAANNPVAGTVTYNAATNTAIFTPSALLATATTFTATVSGAKDSSGNVMSPVSWSFTTEAAPALTNQTPASGVTNVVTTSTVQAVFNKAIQSSTLSFVLKDASGATVASTVAYNASTNTATLTPNALLATATTFTATVSGAKDASGNVMVPVSWSFTTEAAPTVTSKTPASGATNVATTSTVQAVFSKAVVASSISFTLKDAANNPIAGTVTYNAATNTATFTPTTLLATATTFTATVSGATDVSGNLMTPVSWSFTTEAAPTLTSTTPAAGATNVATTAPVQAVFNKSVQSSTISFILKDPSGSTVSATVTYSATTNTATLTPTTPLANSTVYVATVSGAQDASGNVMAPVSWSFTTAAAVTKTWTQSTAADFNSGTNSNTLVTTAPTVGVQLAPSFQDDFNGTALSSNWTATPNSTGGGPLTVTVSGGLMSLQGGDLVSQATYTFNTAVEARLDLGASPSHYFGLSTGFATAAGNYWVAFSTKGTSTTLYARLNRNGTLSDVSLGTLPTGFHVYTIRPTSNSFRFYVDGVLQTTLKASFPSNVNPNLILSAAQGAPAPAIQADWVRVLSYPSTGTFTSSVFDSGKLGTTWGTASWTFNLPTGTAITVQTRSGNTATPDGTWSAWTTVTNGGTVASPAARYLQYQVTFTTTDPTQTASIFSTSFNWS